MSTIECLKQTIKTLIEVKKHIREITKKSYEDNGSIGSVLVQRYGLCSGKVLSVKYLSFGKVVSTAQSWEPVAQKREVLLKAVDDKIAKIKERLAKKPTKPKSGGGGDWMQTEQQLEKFSLFGGDFCNTLKK